MAITTRLTGTQLNGLSAGASYGDDAEMDTNYPIIELQKRHGTGLLRADVQLEQHRSGHGQYAGDAPIFRCRPRCRMEPIR